MNNFAELARIVTNMRAQKIDLLYGETNPSENKYQKLAQTLADNPDLTEEESEEIVGASRNASAYRMFRLRFKEKMLNNLLLSEVEGKTNYSKTIVNLNRNVYCIKILLMVGARLSAMELAEQTLKKAVEFQLVDVALYCCFILRGHQKHTYDVELFEYYRDQYNYYVELQHAENKAIEYYDAFQVTNGKTHVFTFEDAKIAEKHIEEVKLLYEKYDTYQIGLNYYRLLANYRFNAHDYNGALEAYDEASGLLERYKHFEYNSKMGEMLIGKMYMYLYLHDYQNGINCAAKCAEIFHVGHSNWFHYNELFFLISVHTKNYKQAGQILEQVTKNPHFKFRQENIKERWRIFEAYYFILLKAGVAEPYSKSSFRFSSFLNSVTIHSKDKKGFNTSIIVVELMYHLLNKEHHIMTEKIDAVRRYSKRHFEDQANYRSNIFLKMMIECEKYRFEKEEVLKKTKKLQDQLAETQFTFISSLDGIEIVPFTDLWEIVCSRLD